MGSTTMITQPNQGIFEFDNYGGDEVKYVEDDRPNNLERVVAYCPEIVQWAVGTYFEVGDEIIPDNLELTSDLEFVYWFRLPEINDPSKLLRGNNERKENHAGRDLHQGS